MNNLYDILEICLQEIEHGVDLEALLARYPDFAEELRPILQASVNAKQLAAADPSADVMRRNRAKLLQRAAQMREGQPAATNRWLLSFQRLAVAFVLLIMFFVSGTSLVRASSSALPGDSLYSVKRSWEDVTLFFTFNANARETLEIEYENERLDEINMLFASGRPAKVDFSGKLTRQNGAEWRVANILVIVSEQTKLPNQPFFIGSAVRVIGTTNGNGVVYAEKIELLPAGSPLPEVEDDLSEDEVEKPQATPKPANNNSGSGSEVETPVIKSTKTPSPVPTPKIESFDGILKSINKNIWTVDNILVDVAKAEIKGAAVIGARVKAEGYYRSDGVFVAMKIEIIIGGSSNNNLNSNNNNNGGSKTNDNSNENGNANSNDDDDNGSSGKDGNNNDDNNNNGG